MFGGFKWTYSKVTVAAVAAGRHHVVVAGGEVLLVKGEPGFIIIFTVFGAVWTC